MNYTINMYDPKRDYENHKSEYDTAIQQVLNHGIFINGPEISELEDKLSEYVGVKNCICVSNGTDALKIALLALNVGFGDEVITVAHTWISTAEVISIIGAKPVFIDIEDDLFCMDPKKLEQKITDKTKAIIVVSLYGQIPDIYTINEIALKYNIPVIEDGAQSFGASINGKKSCSLSTIGTTSFFPSKPLGCYGDGGACFTNDDMIATKIRAIKSHGGLKRFCHKYIGLNCRLDTIQAAILLVKFKHFENCLENRNKIAYSYIEKLADLDNEKLIKLPKIRENNIHAWAQFSILVNTKEIRDNLVCYMKEHNVNVAIFYPSPLHTQECFEYLGYENGDLPVTERVCDTIINLPCYGEITEDEIEIICKIFRDGIFKVSNVQIINP